MEFSRIHLLSIIIVYAICMPSKTFARCPTSLPLSRCAVIYQSSHTSITHSCTGRSRSIYHGTKEPKLRPLNWNDRISAIVVRDSCTFTGYQYQNYKGSRKAFTTTNHHLKNIRWNDAISSYDCKCNYRGINCKAGDKWEKIQTCVNRYSKDIDCTYSVSYGTTLGKQITNGGYFSTTLTATVKAGLFGLFSASLGTSVSTGFNWETTDIFSETTTKTYTVKYPVGPGDTVSLYQVVGKCGDSKVKTKCYLVWNENKGTVTGQKCEGSNSRNNIHVRTEDNIVNITMGNDFFNASMENKFVKSFMESKFVKGSQDYELSNGSMVTDDVNDSMDDESSNTSINDEYINATMDDGYTNTSMEEDYNNDNVKDEFDNGSQEDEYINANMEDGNDNITIGNSFLNYIIDNKDVNGSSENGFVNSTTNN